MTTDSLLQYAPRGFRPPFWPLPALAAALLAGAGLSEILAAGPESADGSARSIVVHRGDSVSRVAASLEEAGIIRSALAFSAASRLVGADTRLRAGEYRFRSGASLAEVLRRIRAGETLSHAITIPEGWTSAAIVRHLSELDILDGAPPESPPEGRYLPDTYFVVRGQRPADLLARMARAQDKHLRRLWRARKPGLPLGNPQQARILASIVQAEAADPGEMRRVAAVFVNRLRRKMRLESDPTVIYGLTEGAALGRGLRQSELRAKTPYNTYQVDGLPPTPICNPGAAALAAVLDPSETEELFFVADGEGGHRFARTYEEHTRNVALWRKVEAGRRHVGTAR